MPRFMPVELILVLSFSLSGCGKEPVGRVEQFKRDQAATVTTHGPIEMDSVNETPSGVSYKTKDGSAFSVDVSTGPDGSQRFGEPVPVKR
jgi:hypothetical protein